MPLSCCHAADVFPFVRELDVLQLQGEVAHAPLVEEELRVSPASLLLPALSDRFVTGDLLRHPPGQQSHPPNRDAAGKSGERQLARQNDVFPDEADDWIVGRTEVELTCWKTPTLRGTARGGAGEDNQVSLSRGEDLDP